MQAVYHLSTVRPHEARERGYTRVEWPIYCEGYYTALVFALRVMQLALERRQRVARHKRRAAAAARRAA